MKTISELESQVPKKKEKGKVHYHCKVCGYDWWSTIKNPKECPACKSRFWKTGITPTGKKAVSKTKGDEFE